MSLEHLLNEITSLHTEMKDITLKIGIAEEDYNQIIVFDGQMTEEELQKRADFLFNIRHREYHNYLDIWRLLSPEVWARYKNFGFKSLREQKLLLERKKRLKRVWNNWIREYHDSKQDKNQTVTS